MTDDDYKVLPAAARELRKQLGNITDHLNWGLGAGLCDTNEVGSLIADTNTCGWGVDDIAHLGAKVEGPFEEEQVKVFLRVWLHGDDPPDDKPSYGDKIELTATLVVHLKDDSFWWEDIEIVKDPMSYYAPDDE